MPKSKMHTLRKLVHVGPKRVEEPDDDLLMVGKSEVPVSPPDQPPTHLVQSMNNRPRNASPPSPRHSTHWHHTGHHSPPTSASGAKRTNSPPMTPPQSFRTADSLSLNGYRRSPAPEPIMEVDEVDDGMPLDGGAARASWSTSTRDMGDSPASSAEAVDATVAEAPVEKSYRPIEATARRSSGNRKRTAGKKMYTAYDPDRVVNMHARAQLYTCVS
ncbi:hypothetical protein MCOR02_004329 [Pyricularia oryzae]|uniref:Uncharacterized protein n=1 Tax=Pyricularia grisea TaxID=148305 RepID=A0ABQ8NEV7_PYRGI|nr:hypothetical protein MCOR01_006086 [Pyricularia oryzae]KAI6295487.1 hypothetical protein MCOR33_007636 [Pyricularia grisea]KAH9435390.1 hypothetical protein MCOR02_004329 [Pyricularia oryzae]KAI6259805.1 hypothetical protein MCOR19_003833 [Pyricularia oryzae]KAI6278729.1 hypothetical protein MCOR26_004551 [Pyricularia oryzae]